MLGSTLKTIAEEGRIEKNKIKDERLKLKSKKRKPPTC
jgi:hypothetical protein